MFRTCLMVAACWTASAAAGRREILELDAGGEPNLLPVANFLQVTTHNATATASMGAKHEQMSNATPTHDGLVIAQDKSQDLGVNVSGMKYHGSTPDTQAGAWIVLMRLLTFATIAGAVVVALQFQDRLLASVEQYKTKAALWKHQLEDRWTGEEQQRLMGSPTYFRLEESERGMTRNDVGQLCRL
mmetsp:Transcript_50872/g.111420  ORF Transcript_50872/g.111420 Transcript_50872/m.111420 type:complete len:186 (+) Transcript_50872:127-684(+)